MKKKMTRILLILILIPALGSFGCSAGPEGEGDGEIKRYEAEFLNLFDTMTKIVGYSQNKEVFETQVEFVHDELEKYHQLFDIYNDYQGVNNVKTINDNAGAAPVKVDAKIIEFIEYSKEIYRLTDGKVNIAFGSVLSIWHDYRDAGLEDPENAQLPPMPLLEKADKFTDINAIIIDKDAYTVYLPYEEMQLDVGAIAKGYGVEKACEAAEKQFETLSMLVSVGGNVRAVGDKAGGDGTWKVGVQDPMGGAKSLTTVKLQDKESLVTSGDYQRYYTVNGQEYHHIIDPETLMPARYFKAVTIICKDSGLADGLSTGAYLMESDKSMDFINNMDGVEALYVMHDDSIEYTNGFEYAAS